MTYYQPTYTCRICKKWEDQNMVKYGVRHHAHFKCFIDAGKSLGSLHDWQILQFPFRLLKENGLHGQAEAAQLRIKAEQRKG